MSDEPVFVDTNILVYAHDLDAKGKHQIARDKVELLWKQELLPSISVQVLQEFYVTLLKKKIPMKAARETVSNYLEWDVVANDRSIFSEGMRIQERWKVSYWDALILATAKKAKANIVWSEDLNPDQDYDGIRVINPFL